MGITDVIMQLKKMNILYLASFQGCRIHSSLQANSRAFFQKKQWEEK